MDYNKLYEENARYKAYVDKCAAARNVSAEEVMALAITKEYAKECIKKPETEEVFHSVEMTIGCDRGSC